MTHQRWKMPLQCSDANSSEESDDYHVKLTLTLRYSTISKETPRNIRKGVSNPIFPIFPIPVSPFHCVYGEEWGKIENLKTKYPKMKFWNQFYNLKKCDFAIANNEMKQMMNLELYTTRYSNFELYEIDDAKWKQLLSTIPDLIILTHRRPEAPHLYSECLSSITSSHLSRDESTSCVLAQLPDIPLNLSPKTHLGQLSTSLASKTFLETYENCNPGSSSLANSL